MNRLFCIIFVAAALVVLKLLTGKPPPPPPSGRSHEAKKPALDTVNLEKAVGTAGRLREMKVK